MNFKDAIRNYTHGAEVIEEPTGNGEGYGYYCKRCGFSFYGTKKAKLEAELGHRRAHLANIALMPFVCEGKDPYLVLARPELAEMLVSRGGYRLLKASERSKTADGVHE